MNKINVNVETNAIVNGNSMIDAKYANNFSLICHGSCDDHFEIYAPMSKATGKNNDKAFITCIEYGCKSLDLYTQNNANDITFIPLECPCEQDMETACIDSWDIYCTYDSETNKYLNKSQFISATQCVGNDSICCGGIIDAMHETKCGDNDYYMCAPGQDCFIDCNNISETHTVFSNFSCNTKQSIINATHATSLTVLCHEGSHSACNNLTVFCPKDTTNGLNVSCNVNCDGENGCNSLNIDAQMTAHFILNCSADETCVNVAIINSDLVELNCLNNGCLNIDVNAMGSLNVYCADGICNELLLDCSHCANFIFNCNGAGQGICSNSILKAANTTHFELQCSSYSLLNSKTGCHNITAYIPPQNKTDKEKHALVLCDYYGCHELNIFILDKAVTDDINFTVTNCPCEAPDVESLCVNQWNLYCNGNVSKPSVFTHGKCDDECCGEVIEAFREPQCSPFNCAVLQNDICVIDCTDLSSDEYICENEVIKPNSATGLNLYCEYNINCNNMEVNCPSFDHNIFTTDAVCNIYCDGEDNCRNMSINSNGINNFNFDCNGQCNDISINNHNNNNNILTINCNNANCNNMNIFDVGQSSINIICEDECVFNQLIMDGSQSKQLYINGNGNGIITNSIFNTCNMTLSDTLFTNNIIDATSCTTQNISLFNNNASSNVIKSPNVHHLFMDIVACSFYNNSLFIDNVQTLLLNLTSGAKMNSNNIYGDYVHTTTMYMSLHAGFINNMLFASHATNIMISNKGIVRDNILNATNVKMLTYSGQFGGTLTNNVININSANNTLINGTMIDNIINANNALNVSLINLNEGGVIIGNIINIYNASYSFIQNQYIYSSNIINANNITTFIFECSGNFIECGTDSKTDYFNLNNSQKLIHFTIGGIADNLLFGGFGGNILAEHAYKIQMNIGTNTKIENINNTLLINGYNSSILTINNYGLMQNVYMNATLSKQITIINYENGVIKDGILFCEQSANVNIINNGNLHKTTINARNSSNISLKCVDNLLCDIEVNANYATNVVYNCFAGNNEKNIINYNTNDNNFDLNANYARSVSVTIDGFLRHSTSTNINAQYAESIIISVDGLLNNSVINGQNAKKLSVECAASETKYGCHNVSIISSPVINGVPSSYLSCIKYGCQNMVLYTRNDANDLDVTGKQCPCEEDVTSLCINQWQIHCKNDTNGVSIFEGLKNCIGDCCGSVDTRLEESYCQSSHKSKKIKTWIYIVIAAASFCLIVTAIAAYVYKKRKNRLLLLNQ